MAKNGRPEPNTAGTRVTTTWSISPSASAWPPIWPAATSTTEVAGELLGGGDGRLDAVDEREGRRAGVLPVGRRLVGDDEDVLAGGGLAVPAVGDVEDTPADDVRGHVAIDAEHEVARRLAGPDLAVGVREGPGDVAVAQPVEQRSDAVVVVGHEPVEGDDGAHDGLAHADHATFLVRFVDV